jgi:glycosyltransferase involved in cell wall biosynthesis
MNLLAQEIESAPTSTSPTLRGRDIVCFSNDWSGDPLSKTHIMRLLSQDNRILWVNSIGYRAPKASKADLTRMFKKLVAATQPIREPEPNIFVLNPLAVPAYGSRWARPINRHWLRFQVRRAMRRLGFQRPISWSFLPGAAVVAGSLGEEQIIYHCVDEFSAFSGVPSQAIAELEEDLMRRSDLVIVSSERLYESKERFNPRTVLVRHGVDYQHFRKALNPSVAVSLEIADLPRPIIGFFGLIADWVDTDLIAYVARHFGSGSLVLLGKATTDVSRLESLPNVHLLGRKPYEDLPSYCKGFDVALMPFRINQLTLNSNPLKVREYLAAGLPVISTPIPEVEVLGQCRIAATPEDFVQEITQALADPGPSLQRSEAIQHESWEARLHEIDDHLASCPRRPLVVAGA